MSASLIGRLESSAFRLDAVASVAEVKQSYNMGVPPALVPHGWQDTGSGGLSLNWQIDFFGKRDGRTRLARFVACRPQRSKPK